MNNLFYKKHSLNIFYSKNSNLRYESNFNNLDNYIDLLTSNLSNNDKNQFYIVQIVTSLWLSDEILRFRNKEKKEKYMNSDTYEKISKLDKFIIDERIGYYQNNNRKYTKQFNTEIDNIISDNKLKNINQNYDYVYIQVLKKYRNQRISELNLSNEAIEKLIATEIVTDWTRKFELPLKNGDIMKFDHRNTLTTLFCYWNHTEGFSILWVWWDGSSFQRQTFTEMSYVMQKILNKTNWNILKTDLLYYNDTNELEIINEWLINKFFLNYDLWSNSDILYDNKNIKEQLTNYMPYIESDFFNNDNSIYNNKYICYNISLWQSIDEWLLYIYENTDLNKTYLYFGDKNNAYWDDRNDTPSDCNSWIPYSEFLSSIIEFEWLLSEYISISDNNSNKSMDYIKDNNLELYTWINYGEDKVKILLKVKEYWNINKIY